MTNLMKSLCKEITGYPAGEIVIRKGESDEPLVCAYFMDLECDPFHVEYNDEGDITIQTGGNQYLMVEPEQLTEILDLGIVAEEKWRELDRFLDGPDGFEYIGWEHLITPSGKTEGAQ